LADIFLDAKARVRCRGERVQTIDTSRDWRLPGHRRMSRRMGPFRIRRFPAATRDRLRRDRGKELRVHHKYNHIL